GREGRRRVRRDEGRRRGRGSVLRCARSDVASNRGCGRAARVPMANHVPRSVYSSLFMLTAFPAAIVGLGTALAVGSSTPAVVAITLACFGLGSLSLLIAVALAGDSSRPLEHESEAETRRRTLPGLVRTAGLVF